MTVEGSIPRGRRYPAWPATAGAPLAVLGILALLSRVEIVSNGSLRIDVAVVLVFLASVYYLILDWRLGLAVLGVSIVLYLAGVVLPLWLAVVLMIGGCALLLISYMAKQTS